MRNDMKRRFILLVSGHVAGRFTSLNAAHAEEERVCRLALRDGHAVTTKIVETECE